MSRRRPASPATSTKKAKARADASAASRRRTPAPPPAPPAPPVLPAPPAQNIGALSNGTHRNGTSGSNGTTRILIPDWAMALGRVPTALWVATAAHDGRRRSLRAMFVQQAALSPLLVSVALPRGPALAPLVRETGVIGLSLLSRAERYIVKRWEDKRRGLDDLLDGPESLTLSTGVPLLKRSVLVLEGRVVRHVDLEADHELFVLQIVGGRALDAEATPAQRTRAHGLEA